MAAHQSQFRTVLVQAATRRAPCGTPSGAPSSAQYAAHVGHGLLTGSSSAAGAFALAPALIDAATRLNGASPRRVLIAHDRALAPAPVDAVARSLTSAGLEVAHAGLVADEHAKSLNSVEELLAAGLAAKLERTDCFVALGGGIVGDLTGFAASMYRRGVAWCNIPTTLLSMVDASIGGKTGVNLVACGSLLKNMAGAFHDPALVVCDTATLATLPIRELVAGLAECVKHAMIERSVPAAGGQAQPASPSLWSRLDALATDLACGPLDHASLVDLIADNLALKARVVGADPFETAADVEGGRALLNLGHTFGHALETMDGLVPRSFPASTAIPRSSPMSHGEAVALGLVAACVAGERLGISAADLTRQVETLLSRLGLPTRVDNLSHRVDDAISRMHHDKKARAGSLRIIVPAWNVPPNPQNSGDIGTARVVSNPDLSALRAAISHVAG